MGVIYCPIPKNKKPYSDHQKVKQILVGITMGMLVFIDLKEVLLLFSGVASIGIRHTESSIHLEHEAKFPKHMYCKADLPCLIAYEDFKTNMNIAMKELTHCEC